MLPHLHALKNVSAVYMGLSSTAGLCDTFCSSDVLFCAQMRFGGNIGVHAINRTSAAQLPGQPQAQNRAMLGGLGLNNPLTAGLAGTVAGAPRPGLKPNWQAQRVQTHAQAAVAAQQAAQVQQVGSLATIAPTLFNGQDASAAMVCQQKLRCLHIIDLLGLVCIKT